MRLSPLEGIWIRTIGLWRERAGFFMRKAKLRGPNGVAKRFVWYAVPMVRIHLPPGDLLIPAISRLRSTAAKAIGCCREKARQGLIASAEPRSEHFEVAENRYQQVIEIVRAPASKLTNRLHLLCLMKLILDLPHFRDVTRSSDNKRVTLLPCCR